MACVVCSCGTTRPTDASRSSSERYAKNVFSSCPSSIIFPFSTRKPSPLPTISTGHAVRLSSTLPPLLSPISHRSLSPLAQTVSWCLCSRARLSSVPSLLQYTSTTSTHLQLRPLASLAKMVQSSSSPKQELQTVIQVKNVIIQNKHGENLVGLLHETGSEQLVILCHGFRSSKSSGTIASLADAITKKGISVFHFDFAGNGESEGSFQYGNYLREVDDLRSVLLHFSGSKHAVITILGHSKGGNVVLLYASKYSDVPSVINVSGRYKLEKGIEERLGKEFMQNIKRDGFLDVMDSKGEVQYRVTEESLMERLGTDMHEACLRIDQHCRVLTVHGSLDEIIPIDDAYEFSKIIPNHRLEVIQGANHGYSKHKTELADIVWNFIDESIQQQPAGEGNAELIYQ